MSIRIFIIRMRESRKLRAFGECLGTSRRRRTWYSAKSYGEVRTTVDP